MSPNPACIHAAQRRVAARRPPPPRGPAPTCRGLPLGPNPGWAGGGAGSLCGRGAGGWRPPAVPEKALVGALRPGPPQGSAGPRTWTKRLAVKSTER